MPHSIQAAVHYEVGQPLVLEQIELADPGPDDVRVELSAVAICHSDLTFLDGGWTADLPAVWGHEAAGKVAEVGSNVSSVAVGDTVVATLIFSCGQCRSCQTGSPVTCSGHRRLDDASPLSAADGTLIAQGMRIGAFAEQVVVHQSQVIPFTESVPAASAALLACGVITGVGAVVNTARVMPASTVVVIGGGGVGINVIQGARLAGAAEIIAVEPNAAKHSQLLEFGATHVLSPIDTNLDTEVAAIADGRLADYVFIATGAPAALLGAEALLAPNGALVLVGMPAEGVTTEISPVNLAALNQRILGSKMGAAVAHRDIPALVQHYLAGELELDRLVSNTFPLTEINEAIAQVRQGDALRNVIVFEGAG